MIQAGINELHLEQINRKLNFNIGDLVKVHYRITEGDKQRIQIYEGTVIAIKNKGIEKTFTVRRISSNVGVERIFPVYAPTIEKIEKIKSGRVRRSKLYYLRDKVGKHARLKEMNRKGKENKDLQEDQMFDKAQDYQKVLAEKKAKQEESKATEETTES